MAMRAFKKRRSQPNIRQDTPALHLLVPKQQTKADKTCDRVGSPEGLPLLASPSHQQIPHLFPCLQMPCSIAAPSTYGLSDPDWRSVEERSPSDPLNNSAPVNGRDLGPVKPFHLVPDPSLDTNNDYTTCSGHTKPAPVQFHPSVHDNSLMINPNVSYCDHPKLTVPVYTPYACLYQLSQQQAEISAMPPAKCKALSLSTHTRQSLTTHMNDLMIQEQPQSISISKSAINSIVQSFSRTLPSKLSLLLSPPSSPLLPHKTTPAAIKQNASALEGGNNNISKANKPTLPSNCKNDELPQS